MEQEAVQQPVEPTEQVEANAAEQQTPTTEQQAPEQAEQQQEQSGADAHAAKGNAELPKWARKNFFELREENRQLKARLHQQPQEQQAPQEGYVPASEVERLAEQKASQRAFDARCNSVYSDGAKDFKDFDDTIANLGMVGGLSQELLGMIVEGDAPHKVLYELGRDPEKAAAITRMSPMQQAREIARLEGRLTSQTDPARASNAPPPVRPVGSRTSIPQGPSDSDSMSDWVAKRNAELRARGKR